MKFSQREINLLATFFKRAFSSETLRIIRKIENAAKVSLEAIWKLAFKWKQLVISIPELGYAEWFMLCHTLIVTPFAMEGLNYSHDNNTVERILKPGIDNSSKVPRRHEQTKISCLS